MLGYIPYLNFAPMFYKINLFSLSPYINILKYDLDLNLVWNFILVISVKLNFDFPGF